MGFMSRLRYLRDWRRLPARIATLCEAWLGAPHGPSTIQIEHTKRCNLKCVMCAHGSAHPPANEPDMTLDEFKACVDGPHSLGNLTAVHIQGLGEPFLHRDFPAMVRHANRLGLQTGTISNMTVMNERIAEEIVSSGLDCLGVSLDSPDPASIAVLRRGASFDVLARMIENLNLIRHKQAEMKANTPEIIVYAIALKSTLPKLAQMKALLKELKIRKLCFEQLWASEISPEFLMPNGTRVIDEPLTTLPPRELEQAVAEMNALTDDEFMVVPSPIFECHSDAGLREDGIFTCLDLWEHPAIGVNGAVAPCCFTVGGGALNVGNVRQNSFQDIWSGRPFEELRRAHLLGSAPEICRNCSHFYQLIRPWRVFKKNRHPHRYDLIHLGCWHGKTRRVR